MLTKVLGVIWVIFGLLWLWKPDKLKDRLKRKMTKRTKRIVNIFLLGLGFMFILSALKTPGLIAKLIAVIGLVITIKAITLITNKASERFYSWIGGWPVMVFRVVAVFFLVSGIYFFIR